MDGKREEGEEEGNGGAGSASVVYKGDRSRLLLGRKGKGRGVRGVLRVYIASVITVMVSAAISIRGVLQQCIA